MTQNSGRQVFLAAGIVGAAAIVAYLILAQSINGVTQQNETPSGAIGSENGVLATFDVAPTPVPRESAAPDRRYTVNIEGAPAMGPATAAVTLIEFSDFECSFCAEVGPTLERVREVYGDKVRIVFKHLPLSIHAKAPAAHAAAEAAFRQGKFWEMHDKIFENQPEMSPEKYREYATELGLDIARFERDIQSGEVNSRIDADKKEAAALGARATPMFYINGRAVKGALPFESFKKAIDQELAREKSA